MKVSRIWVGRYGVYATLATYFEWGCVGCCAWIVGLTLPALTIRKGDTLCPLLTFYIFHFTYKGRM